MLDPAHRNQGTHDHPDAPRCRNREHGQCIHRQPPPNGFSAAAGRAKRSGTPPAHEVDLASCRLPPNSTTYRRSHEPLTLATACFLTRSGVFAPNERCDTARCCSAARSHTTPPAALPSSVAPTSRKWQPTGARQDAPTKHLQQDAPCGAPIGILHPAGTHSREAGST
ncbi:hypothetical protein JOF55_003418 [Haloactinomyces albus]|uniref:Uncharacterized protein n=1 Tax=Haloactinomyces albus TaxID=1352928 RepID=A0AAE4CPM5_9ACTN|nr:hypothetical protein [Haloactinomyces albus]